MAFMPRARQISPNAPNSAIAASTRYLLSVNRSSLGLGHIGRSVGGDGGAPTGDILPALRAQLQELLGFLVEPLTFAGLENGIAYDAEDRLRTEIIFVIE